MSFWFSSSKTGSQFSWNICTAWPPDLCVHQKREQTLQPSSFPCPCTPTPRRASYEALWRENCFWRNNPLIHSLVSGVLSAKHTLHSHKAWIWSHQLNSIFWLKRQSLSPNLYLWVPIEPFDLWRNHPPWWYHRSCEGPIITFQHHTTSISYWSNIWKQSFL